MFWKNHFLGLKIGNINIKVYVGPMKWQPVRNHTTWHKWHSFFEGHPETMVSFSDIGFSILQITWDNCRVQERPLHFLVILKVFKNSWILACRLRFTWEILLWIFFGWGALRSREITYVKSSVFQAASFGDLLFNKKQKKPYYFVEQQTGRLFLVYSTES